MLEDTDGNLMRPVLLSNFFRNPSSILYCSKDGVFRRRYENPFLGSHTWGPILKPTENKYGSIGFTIDGKFMSIEKVIANTWSRNKKNRSGMKQRENDESICYYFTDGETDNEVELESSSDDEKWVSYDDRLKISTKGRISNDTEMLSITYVNNKPYVMDDLSGMTISMNDAMSETFLNQKKLPRYLQNFLHALKTGEMIETYCKNNNIKVSTAWSYMYKLFQFIPYDDAMQIARQYCNEMSWNAMNRVFSSSKEDIFNRPALSYMEEIDEMMSDMKEWARYENKHHEIRLLKWICQNQI